MPKNLKNAVVVITGASSGIGRAAALMFAEKGASVVLAARREGALEEVAGQCLSLGGRSLAVPTDMSNERAVFDLARKAVEHFGRIDVWINNAAVLRPIDPIYEAEQVASAMVRCTEHPKREVIVGSAGRFMAVLHAWTPRLFEKVMARQVRYNQFQDKPAPPTSETSSSRCPGGATSAEAGR